MLSKYLSLITHCFLSKAGTIISKECQQIRKLILDPKNDITPVAEFFLYLADRAQHVEKIIIPALDKKQWVISDRYLDSTRIYQGAGRGLSRETIDPMIDYASQGVMPDLTFIMDIPSEIGVERARSTNTEFEGGDRMEREDMSFHKILRAGFLGSFYSIKYYKHFILFLMQSSSIFIIICNN